MAKSYTLPTSGTVLIPVDYATSQPDIVHSLNIMSGTVTLVGALAVSPSGTPSTGQEFNILWNANVTPGVNTITVFGETIPKEMAASNFVANCIYDGSAWVVSVLPDFAGTGIINGKLIPNDTIDTAKIIDDVVTNDKLANIARGSVKVGGASDAPTDLDAKTSGRILVGDGTDIASVAVSGDATLASSGALTIGNDKVTTVKIIDGAVTPSKLDSNAKRFSITVPIDFSSASRLGGTINIPICYDCVIDDLHGTVMDPVSSTCSAIFKDDTGTVMTGSQIDITTGHLLGNVVNSTPTANNTFTAGDSLKIEPSAASTLGGEVLYTICGYLA